MTDHTLHDDVELLALAARHHRLWSEWDLLGDDDPRCDDIARAVDELERAILTTPAFTAAGHRAKRHVFELAGYSDDDGLLAEMVAREGFRVGAR